MEREAKAIVRLIESLKLANFRNKPNKWGIHMDQAIMICALIECTQILMLNISTFRFHRV